MEINGLTCARRDDCCEINGGDDFSKRLPLSARPKDRSLGTDQGYQSRSRAYKNMRGGFYAELDCWTSIFDFGAG